jgi:hypothetical protein
MAKFSRDKGKRAERQAIDLLQPIVDKIYNDAGIFLPSIFPNDFDLGRLGFMYESQMAGRFGGGEGGSRAGVGGRGAGIGQGRGVVPHPAQIRKVTDLPRTGWGAVRVPVLQRNTLQSDRGGMDITGLPWLALEIKHVEGVNNHLLREWWDQCTEQAGHGQVPVLAYKRNNSPFRVRLPGGVGGGEVWVETPVEVGWGVFEGWFAQRVAHELAEATRDLR